MILYSVGAIIWGLMIFWAVLGLREALGPVKDHLGRMTGPMVQKQTLFHANLPPSAIFARKSH